MLPLFRNIYNALRSGHLGGAGLDVVEDEPLQTAEEAATPNLIVTCHAAFCSVEGKLEMRRTAARIADSTILGETLEYLLMTSPGHPADSDGSIFDQMYCGLIMLFTHFGTA